MYTVRVAESALLAGRLRVVGTPLRKGLKEAKREVLAQKVLHHGAIP